LAPMVHHNTLSANIEDFLACLMSRYLINIPKIIEDEIRDRAVGVSTTIPFLSL
ncbi:hypothetical protein HAX54_034741, partial [Datura stramonium]|nr:hypothetical protein [Datura stramonium]